ncbi:hypothetical protein ACOMHN_056257 [Nucella lapillus]
MARGTEWVVVTIGLSTLALILPGVAGGLLLGEGVNGGSGCVACTFGLALVEQLAELHNESEATVMHKLCVSLPTPQLQTTCKHFVDMGAPFLILLLQADPSPDTICHAVGMCNTNPSLPTCHSIPHPNTRLRRSATAGITFQERVKRSRDIIAQQGIGQGGMGMNICNFEGVKEICEFIRSSFGHLVPVSDTDHDFFATTPTLRGSAWRGKDCNDHDAAIRPGTIPINDDITADSNCNGIFGVNPASGVAYEKELCEHSAPRGVAVLGDSMSAHFHIPEAWLDPTQISPEAFKHWRFIIENELNWPHMSYVTGLGFNHWEEAIKGPIDSIYMRLRERNHCNHKDYQNIAVNGAKASTTADYFVKSLYRNQVSDRPLIVFYAMLGMDVCDELAYQTTPATMRQKVLETLNYMDRIVPANSTVFLMGLADGHVLYDTLHDRVHPIARHWNTFTYADYFDFFNCVQVSSCTGWMNTNATIRSMTAQRAKELSAVLQDIAQQRGKTYTNLDVFYMDYPLNKAIEIWKSKGGKIWELLDLVDGFHSNQYGQALVAGVLWEEAERIAPGVFGPTNPNNARIKQLFGDQGSYF